MSKLFRKFVCAMIGHNFVINNTKYTHQPKLEKCCICGAKGTK